MQLSRQENPAKVAGSMFPPLSATQQKAAPLPPILDIMLRGQGSDKPVLGHLSAVQQDVNLVSLEHAKLIRSLSD